MALRAALPRLLPALAAVTTGLLLGFAFPPLDAGWLALVALVPLLAAAERASPLRAAGLGYLAGLVWFAVHIAWIKTFGYLAVGALVAVQALFIAVFAALVPLTRRLGAWRVLLLPACWAAIELARAHVPLGGFPWGLLGLTQHGGGPLLPLARVLGTYGLAAVLVAVNVAVLELLRSGPRARRAWPEAGWAALVPALVLGGLLVPAPPPPDGGEPLDVAVVQGNVPAGDRDDRGVTTEAVFANHLRLSRTLAGDPPELVVWGEGAVDADPLRSADRHARIADVAGEVGAPMLVGATTSLGNDLYATEALLYTSGGELADRYRKRRLVPFGEYVPGGDTMRSLVPATRQVPFQKVPGEGLAPMEVRGLLIGTPICWESAYPEDARQLTADGARLLVVLTNNASWGVSPGSDQHLAAGQLRAVETGRTVVQAAVSGPSAVVLPDGHVEQRTGLYTEEVVRASVQPRSGLTPYVRAGRVVEGALVGLAVLTVVLAAFAARRRPRGDTAPARELDHAGSHQAT